MFVVFFGIKSAFFKKIGYRYANCKPCGDQQRLFFHWRWLLFFQIFFLPVMFLGFDKRWACSVCQESPEEPETFPMFIKILGGFLVLGLITAMLLDLNQLGFSEFLILGLLSILFTWVGARIVKHGNRSKSYLTQFSQELEDQTKCLLCGGELERNRYFFRCKKCKGKAFTGHCH